MRSERLLGLLALCLLQEATSVLVQVGARSQECFYEYVKTKRTAYLRIGVLESSDKYDIRLKAYGPFQSEPREEDESMNFFNELVTSERDEVTNNLQRNGFNFDSEHRGGWYKFCLDNFHSNYEGKVVELYTSYGLSNENELGQEDEMEAYLKKAHIEGASESLERLGTLLQRIRSEQEYYRQRERRHRKTAESNNSRIVWYTTVEIVMLAVMYGAQSFILHKWFSDRGFLTARNWA